MIMYQPHFVQYASQLYVKFRYVKFRFLLGVFIIMTPFFFSGCGGDCFRSSLDSGNDDTRSFIKRLFDGCAINAKETSVGESTSSINATEPTEPTPESNLKDLLYNNQCAGCHGEDKNGVENIGPSLLPNDCGVCSDLASLKTYIIDTMPPGDPSQCAQECADTIASLLLPEQPINVPPIPPEPPIENPTVPENPVPVEQDPPAPSPIVEDAPPVPEEAVPDAPTPELPEIVVPEIPEPQPDPEPAPEIVEAPKPSSYLEFCASCHGNNGIGIENSGPSLLLAECEQCTDLATLVAYIDETMPPEDPTICVGDCAALAALYITLEVNKPPPVTGKDFYERDCANCHGKKGDGGSGPSLLVTECQICNDLISINKIINEKMPMSDTISCTGECAALVSRYVFDGFVEEPRQYTRLEYYNKFGCKDCHGAQGEGGSATALIGSECGSCSNYPLLMDVILEQMPYGEHPALCDIDCALQTAQLIYSQFNERTRLTGKQLYEFSCSDCHGLVGEGGSAPPLTLEACETCNDFSFLVSYIDENMPLERPWVCKEQQMDECALLVSEYITAGFVEEPMSADKQYQIKCAKCHGENGEGASAVGFNLETCSTCNKASSLYFEVLAQMPQGSPHHCQGDCALKLTEKVFNMSHPVGSGQEMPVVEQEPTAPPSMEELVEQAPPETAETPPTPVESPPVPDGNVEMPDAPTPNPAPDEVAAAVVKTGQDYYETQCSSCHGEDGKGGDAPSLRGDKCKTCDKLDKLYLTILDTMPLNDTTSCGEDCAVKTSYYIFNGLKKSSEFTAREYYAGLCSDCHGKIGKGGDAPTLEKGKCETCEDLPSLFTKIVQDMPVGASALCDEECATKVTQYIASDFKEKASPLQGKEYYAVQCANCHGKEGEGEQTGPSLREEDCTICSSLTELILKIDQEMPLGAHSLCKNECAVLVADHVLNGFKKNIKQCKENNRDGNKNCDKSKDTSKE